MKTNRQIRCASCQVQNRISPEATRFTCGNCGALNTISPEARAQAQRRAYWGAVVTLVLSVIIVVVVWQACSTVSADAKVCAAAKLFVSDDVTIRHEAGDTEIGRAAEAYLEPMPKFIRTGHLVTLRSLCEEAGY